MDRDPRACGEGGVKIVFDVPDDQVDQIVEIVGAGSFAVRRYYDAEDWDCPGVRQGALRGWVLNDHGTRFPVRKKPQSWRRSKRCK